MLNNSKIHIFEENKQGILDMFDSGKTKVEIASKYGVSVATVRSWLKGKRRQRSFNKVYIYKRDYEAPKGWGLVFNSMRAMQ